MAAKSKHSAGEQALGYLYQGRLALLKILRSSESTSLLLESADDLEFDSLDGTKSLASLKHKSPGDLLTNLSIDFWKSVRIWLKHYKSAGGPASSLQFVLWTTGKVSKGSELVRFIDEPHAKPVDAVFVADLIKAAGKSKDDVIAEVYASMTSMTALDQEDFFGRIEIQDQSPRIEELPHLIKDGHMRSVWRAHRDAVFERLEGWWSDQVIALLAHKRDEPIVGYEVSDKLSSLAEEYQANNLPITFYGKHPPEESQQTEKRLFVLQLREIGVSDERIRSAILDYYRAFEQRSAWARQKPPAAARNRGLRGQDCRRMGALQGRCL